GLHAHREVVAGDTRSVDEDGDRAEALADGIDEVGAGLRVRDVEDFPPAVDPRLRECGRAAVGPGGAGGRPDDRGALATQLERDRPPDAPRCARHQRDLSLDAHDASARAASSEAWS